MFVVNSCFLYYALVASILVVITWIVILYEYPARHSPTRDLIWPYTKNTWEYLADNVVFYLIWTALVIAFTWAAYLADCTRSLTEERRQEYRAVFFLINLTVLASQVVFYLFHNVAASLICISLAVILTIQLIFWYTVDNTDYGWLVFPFFLWTMYFLAVSYHFVTHNTPDYENRVL